MAEDQTPTREEVFERAMQQYDALTFLIELEKEEGEQGPQLSPERAKPKSPKK